MLQCIFTKICICQSLERASRHRGKTQNEDNISAG
jgi:hypothetical protein